MAAMWPKQNEHCDILKTLNQFKKFTRYICPRTTVVIELKFLFLHIEFASKFFYLKG